MEKDKLHKRFRQEEYCNLDYFAAWQFHRANKVTMIRYKFFAVRKNLDTSKEWVDVDSGNVSAELVQNHVDEIAVKIPKWDKCNPLVRIAEFELVEK